MHKLLIVIFSIFSVLSASAQKKALLVSEKNSMPRWIEMMDDTLTNFFEAENEFNAFWKNLPTPIEEDAILGHTELKKDERNSWLNRMFSKRKEKAQMEAEKYAFQYKRYMNWRRSVWPYVQDDGSILTPAQRIAIWRDQQSKQKF